MPRVEHQPSRRHIRLSDLNTHTQVDGEKPSHYLSSPEWAWVHNILKRRRVKKSVRSANANSAGRGISQQRTLSRDLVNPYLGQQANVVGYNPAVDTSKTRPPQHTPTNESPTLALLPNSRQPLDNHASKHSSTISRTSVSSYTRRDGRVSRHKVRISRPSVRQRSVHLTHTPSNNYQAMPRKLRKKSEVTIFGDFIGSPPKTTRASSHYREPESPPADIVWRSDIFQQSGHESQGTLEADRAVRKRPSSLNFSETIITGPEVLIQREECSMCGTPNSPCTRYGKQGLWLCTACRSPKTAVEYPPGKESTFGPDQSKQGIESEAANSDNSANDAHACEHCHTLLPPKLERDGIFCSWCCQEQTKTIPKANSSYDFPRLTLLRARRFETVPSISTEGAEKEWESFDSYDTDTTGATTPSSTESSNEDKAVVNAKEDYSHGKPAVRVKPTPPLKDNAYLSRKQSHIFLHPDVFTPPPTRNPPPPPKRETEVSSPQSVYTPFRPSFCPNTPFPPSPPVRNPPSPPNAKAKQNSPKPSWTPTRPSSTPDTPFSPPPSRNPPPPPPPLPKTDNSSPQSIYTPLRPSFIPSTPTSIHTSPPLPSSPPNISSRPHLRQRRARARKTSSVYPPTPKITDFAHNLPFPPPPIPAKYALDERGRFGSVGDKEGQVRRDWEGEGCSPGSWRDTRFYDYWEEILGEGGRRGTVGGL